MDDKMTMKYASTDVRLKYASMNARMTRDDVRTKTSEDTVTPPIVENVEEKAATLLNQVCEIGTGGWCKTHNVKTTTITVKSKVWHKKDKKNVFEWKYLRRKKSICKSKSMAQVAHSDPDLSANLGGD